MTSFTCGKHGWRHALNPCPSCSSKKPFYSMSDDFDELQSTMAENRAFESAIEMLKSNMMNEPPQASEPEEQYMVVEKWEKDPLTGSVVHTVVSAEPASKSSGPLDRTTYLSILDTMKLWKELDREVIAEASKPIVDTKPSTINDKPREWWISESEVNHKTKIITVPHVSRSPYPGSIHVIEKSAHDALKAENERLQALCNFASGDGWNEYPKLKAEALKLAEALEKQLNYYYTDGDQEIEMRKALTNWQRYLNGSDNE